MNSHAELENKLAWSVREAAAAIGLPESTVRLEIARGNLAAKRIGRRLLISDQALRGYLVKLSV